MDKPFVIASTPVGRLVFFLIGLVFFAAGYEWFVRRHEHLFEGASHRALAKVAMFDAHSRVEFLFLGTSRTQDGVSPVLVSRALGAAAPTLSGLKGFNAASTGSSLQALESLAPRYTERGGLRLVVVELSQPQLGNAPTPWEVAEAPVVTLEDRLAVSLRRFRAVRYRTVFQSDNLGRLPALLFFAPYLSGWETRGSQQIASWLGREEKSAVGFDEAAWKPVILRETAAKVELEPASEELAHRLSVIAEKFQSRGVKVVFAVTPLAPSDEGAPERTVFQALFREVARRSRCEVWDFSAASAPSALFKDPGHLNHEGRAHYSKALALRMAEFLARE